MRDSLLLWLLCHRLICLFFFQAEDGIRDDLVTGVQTCALPIFDCDDGLPVGGDGLDDRVEMLCEGVAVPPGAYQDQIGRASCRGRV